MSRFRVPVSVLGHWSLQEKIWNCANTFVQPLCLLFGTAAPTTIKKLFIFVYKGLLKILLVVSVSCLQRLARRLPEKDKQWEQSQQDVFYFQHPSVQLRLECCAIYFYGVFLLSASIWPRKCLPLTQFIHIYCCWKNNKTTVLYFLLHLFFPGLCCFNYESI